MRTWEDAFSTRRPRLMLPAISPLRADPTVLDRLVGWLNPTRGLERLGHRAKLQRAMQVQSALRKYEGATSGRRGDNWRTPSRSANADIGPALTRLRARSRDLAQNNPYAVSAVEGIVANTNGAGIMARLEGSSRAVQRAKDLWLDSMDTPEIDADGRDTFYGLQDLVLRTVMESGEALIRRRIRRPEDGLAVPLQLQVLEPDHLDTLKDGLEANGNRVIQGVEFDRLGRRVAYWIFPEHPGESFYLGHRSFDSQRIPATEILHVFLRKRAGQARGVPKAVSVILRLRNWDEYEDATLQKQLIAACFAAFEIDVNSGADVAVDPKEPVYPVDTLESGTIQRLAPGHDIKFANPPQIAELDEFASVMLHAIAAGWEVPYELMTGDYSRTNYSSARMAWNEFNRRIETWRWKLMVPQFCAPVFAWWQEAAVLSGALRGDVRAKWRAPRKELLDPTKEVPAIRAAVRSGLQSLDQAIAEQGEDPDEVLAEIAETNSRLDALGLVLDTDPRKVTLSGILQAGDVPDSEKTAQPK